MGTSAQSREPQPKIAGGTPGGPIGRVILAPPYAPMISTLHGAPLSAEVGYETTHLWRGGNEIRQQIEPYRIYRDSHGRVRVDHKGARHLQSGFPLGPCDVDIFDPVAGRSYSLDTEKRIAYAFSSAVGTRAGPLHPESFLPPEPLGDLMPLPAVMVRDGKVFGLKPERQRRSLGTKRLEGLSVVGSQLIVAVSAGWNGFHEPFEVSIEVWWSDDLDMVVLWKCVDPRSGISTWKLTNVSREEPDPTLFRAPAGYTLDDRAGR
jgi:hypothetical protein